MRHIDVTAEISEQSRSQLSDGELDVALQVVEGYSNAQIAARRNSKTRTVANQISSAFRKLSAQGRVELIVRLFE